MECSEENRIAVRVLIPYEPFARQQRDWDRSYSTLWPADWVSCPGMGMPPFMTGYCLRFTLSQPARIRVHVTADERYELFLDGVRIGRGPERGDPRHWFFETYDLHLEARDHVLVARVWSLGKLSPTAQMSVRAGFLLAAEPPFTELLSTGPAAWMCRQLGGITFLDPGIAWGTGARWQVDAAAFPWGFQRGEGSPWQPAQRDLPGRGASGANHYGPEHLLLPATLPAMIEVPRTTGRVRHISAASDLELLHVPIRAADHRAEEQLGWQALVEGRGAVTIPPDTLRRIVIDLEDYYTAYPDLITSGGAGSQVRLHWAEALYLHLNAPRIHNSPKGNRNEIEGKFFLGVGDVFYPDGAAHRHFETLWWRSGRYLEVVVQTACEPLIIEHFGWRETRYPLEMHSTFACSEPRMASVLALSLRALQMCAQETYLDCPYYEQLMYVGDSRLQALTGFTLTPDDRLARKSLLLFDASRQVNGLTCSQYPSRVTQLIPPFALWWIAMVHDFARWRDDPAFVTARMPGVRAVLDYFLERRNREGLVAAPEGWNFMDWVVVPKWPKGIPPDGVEGVSGMINAQLALVLGLAAELETGFGQPDLVARYQRAAREVWRGLTTWFWDEQRGLFADDLAHDHFSEHTQCLAFLSGPPDSIRQQRLVQGLLQASDLAKASVYFSHYLLEVYQRTGHSRAIVERLQEWFDLDTHGFRTTPEEPEPSRSDCHAWGAHPLYHCFATILGIRPADFGFRSVAITPLLSPLVEARGTLPHPRGEIAIELQMVDDRLSGWVVLPSGTTGHFHAAGQSHALHEGGQPIDVPFAREAGSKE